MPTGDDCLLYSASVSKHWNPGKINRPLSRLEFDTCYSSWHEKNDIAQSVAITGTKQNVSKYSVDSVKDGFFCDTGKMYYGYTSSYNREGWMQIDLKEYHTLKCLKIFAGGAFCNIEFRFGNYSKTEDWSRNVFLAYSKEGLNGTVVEYCFDRPVVGRYVHLESKKEIGKDFIQIGEIQVLVK